MPDKKIPHVDLTVITDSSRRPESLQSSPLHQSKKRFITLHYINRIVPQYKQKFRWY